MVFFLILCGKQVSQKYNMDDPIRKESSKYQIGDILKNMRNLMSQIILVSSK